MSAFQITRRGEALASALRAVAGRILLAAPSDARLLEEAARLIERVEITTRKRHSARKPPKSAPLEHRT